MKRFLYLTLAILLLAVYTVNSAQTIVPGSSFPIWEPPHDWDRFLGVNTNGDASNNSLTRSNFTASWGFIRTYLGNLSSNYTDQKIAALAPNFPWLIVTNGSSTATIQSQFNSLTNGGVIAFQTGDYSITARLLVTNSMIVLGDGATLHWTNASALLLTNYMFDTGTNYGKHLVVEDLGLDGGVYAAYNTSAYYDATHFIPNGIYGDVYWSNRTAMRIEASGGALISRCRISGWSGNGILGLNKADIKSYTTGKLTVFQNAFSTNFIDIALPNSGFQVPGYNNSDSSLWVVETPQYASVINNNHTGSQIALMMHTANTVASGNLFVNCYIGVSMNSAGGTQRVFNNNMNHCTYGVFLVGPGAFHIITENTFIGMNGPSLFADAAQNFVFDNNMIDKDLIATNGCTGFIRNNTLFPGYVWGVTLATNFTGSPNLYVYNNADMSVTSFDPSWARTIINTNTWPPTYGSLGALNTNQGWASMSNSVPPHWWFGHFDAASNVVFDGHMP